MLKEEATQVFVDLSHIKVGMGRTTAAYHSEQLILTGVGGFSVYAHKTLPSLHRFVTYMPSTGFVRQMYLAYKHRQTTANQRIRSIRFYTETNFKT